MRPGDPVPDRASGCPQGCSLIRRKVHEKKKARSAFADRAFLENRVELDEIEPTAF